MPLDELRIANDLLRVALERYANACLSVKQYLTDGSPLESTIDSTLTDELSTVMGYETKLHESRAVIAQSVNLCPGVIPFHEFPTEVLTHIFQLLVDMSHRAEPHPWAGVPTYPLRLTHVCTTWRRMVHHSPSLWSHFILYPNPDSNEKLQAYSELYSSRAQGALMDISISNSPASQDPNIHYSSEYTIPISFIGRIRSLDVRFFIPRESSLGRQDTEWLLTKCLQASNQSLKRLALNMVVEPPRAVSTNSNDEWEGILNNPHSSRIVLFNEDIEDALSPISDLSLKGVRFNWKSEAYQGLVSLRLDRDDSCSLTESDLMGILESSPRLRFIHIDSNVYKTCPDLLPMHLPDLELLVGNASLLRLIRPGSNELTVTIMNSSPRILQEPTVKGFFTCANLVNFYSDDFLHDTADVCQLLSIAPRLRGLAISHIELDGFLPDSTRYTLDTLHLLYKCAVEWTLLEDIANIWAVKNILFDRAGYRVHGKGGDISYSWLKEDFSARGIQVGRVRHTGRWTPPMDLFVGAPFRG